MYRGVENNIKSTDTSGDCSYNLCLSQRDGSFEKKWFHFDNCVNSAIHMLSKFEASHGTIYTGLCDISIGSDKRKLKQIVGFKTNVSFTTDYEVAEEFRGSNGMIMGINMKSNDNSIYLFSDAELKLCACDVSWISHAPREKEILIKRGCAVDILPHMIKYNQEQQNQWIVCGSGVYSDQTNSSFSALFYT